MIWQSNVHIQDGKVMFIYKMGIGCKTLNRLYSVARFLNLMMLARYSKQFSNSCRDLTVWLVIGTLITWNRKTIFKLMMLKIHGTTRLVHPCENQIDNYQLLENLYIGQVEWACVVLVLFHFHWLNNYFLNVLVSS